MSFGKVVEPRICFLIKDRARRLDHSSYSQESFRKVWTSCFCWRNKHETYASIFLGTGVHRIRTLISGGLGFRLVLYYKAGQDHLPTSIRCSRLPVTQFEYKYSKQEAWPAEGRCAGYGRTLDRVAGRDQTTRRYREVVRARRNATSCHRRQGTLARAFIISQRVQPSTRIDLPRNPPSSRDAPPLETP